MKNIIIVVFLIAPSFLMAQNGEICVSKIACDARGLYMTVSYNMTVSSSVTLSCNFGLTDNTSRTATFTEVLVGTGTRDILLVRIACNTVNFTTPMNVRYYNSNTGLDVGMTYLNGLCTSRVCCVRDIFPSSCNLSISATQIKTCSTLGNVSLSLSGGIAPFTYLWSTGATTSTLTPTTVGTYAVTVTDVNNCRVIKSDIAVTGNLSVITTSEPRTCTTRGKASAIPSGGTPPYRYRWNTGNTESSLSDLFPNTYSVTVTDALNCTVMKDVIVTEQCTTPLCNMSVTATTQAKMCSSAGTATVSVTSGRFPYTYRWSNGATTNFVANLNAGTYAVTITDAWGCRIVKSDIIVTDNCAQNCTLSAVVTVRPKTCREPGFIRVYPEGGTAPYRFLWSNGSTSSGFINTGSGAAFSVTVTDANSCTTVKDNIIARNNCLPPDCPKYIDNCYEEWEQFILKNYAPSRCKQWETECDTKSDIRRDGKVAIGLNLTSVPDGFKLAVQGGVITNDVKVKLCGSGERWCDYVFEKTYKLMPLADVSKYIYQNKRLPNMPSTADIDKENGYEIKKLALLQQEKIEEAYLHLIKLEEKVKNLTGNVEKKRQRNNKIAHLLKIENEK